MRLVRSPPRARLVVLGYPDVFDAADDVPAILAYGPIGLEGLRRPSSFATCAKRMRLRRNRAAAAGRGWLLVEFGAGPPRRPTRRPQRLADGASAAQMPVPTFDASAIRTRPPRIWAVRESALGADGARAGQAAHVGGLGGRGGAARAARALPGAICARCSPSYGYSGRLYGHFGDGCVHTRIELRSRDRAAASRSSARSSTTRPTSSSRIGGSLSGEHGDGQSRGALLPQDVRAGADGGVPRVQGALGSRREDESRQADRRARAAREPPPRRRLRAATGRDALPLPARRRSARHADAALRRRGRVPTQRRRHDVPELQVDARGEAFDARPRAAAVRDAAGRSRSPAAGGTRR